MNDENLAALPVSRTDTHILLGRSGESGTVFEKPPSFTVQGGQQDNFWSCDLVHGRRRGAPQLIHAL
jgi:hypothetical protein